MNLIPQAFIFRFARYSTIFVLIFIGLIAQAIACSLPPDIIHEFRLEIVPGKNLEIRYSLATWGNLKDEITWKIDWSWWIAAYLDTNISKNTTIKIDGVPIWFTFLTWSLVHQDTMETDLYSVTQSEMLEWRYTTSLPSDILGNTKIELIFQKDDFTSITSLIHPYLFSNIQKDGTEWSYFLWEDDEQYFTYNHSGRGYRIRNTVKEWTNENHFTLYISPHTTEVGSFTGPKTKEVGYDFSWFLSIFTKVGNTLEVFFYERGNEYVRMVWLFLALLLWMGHALLPGHSKSLITTFIVSQKKVSPYQILILIGSSAFSHTFFLFILATIVLLLQKGISQMAWYIVALSALGYMVFGLYFIKRWREMLVHTRFHLGKIPDCHCVWMPKVSSRQSILTSWVLAGMNPCIDALALFLLAMSIGDTYYAIMMILLFSAGLGLMLGILAWIISGGKSWLSKKSEYTSEKFSAYMTLYSGIFITLLWSYTLFR